MRKKGMELGNSCEEGGWLCQKKKKKPTQKTLHEILKELKRKKLHGEAAFPCVSQSSMIVS